MGLWNTLFGSDEPRDPKQLPDWMAYEPIPPKTNADGVVIRKGRDLYHIDGDIYYPRILREIRGWLEQKTNDERRTQKGDPSFKARYGPLLTSLNVKTPDRYWAQVAHQFMKLDARLALITADQSPWPNEFRTKADKGKWHVKSLTDMPAPAGWKDPTGEGYGVFVADRGGPRPSARTLYRQMRKSIPGNQG